MDQGTNTKNEETYVRDPIFICNIFNSMVKYSFSSMGICMNHFKTLCTFLCVDGFIFVLC